MQNILNKYLYPAFLSIEIIYESQGLNKVTKVTRSCHFFRNNQNFKDRSELLHGIPFTLTLNSILRWQYERVRVNSKVINRPPFKSSLFVAKVKHKMQEL